MLCVLQGKSAQGMAAPQSKCCSRFSFRDGMSGAGSGP